MLLSSRNLGQQRLTAAGEHRQLPVVKPTNYNPSSRRTPSAAAERTVVVGCRNGSKAYRGRRACVVQSVLAESPSSAVEGFSRGAHWQVHKFGGTCMASPERLKAVAELVSDCCDW
jgi:hypothetical protein